MVGDDNPVPKQALLDIRRAILSKRGAREHEGGKTGFFVYRGLLLVRSSCFDRHFLL